MITLTALLKTLRNARPETNVFSRRYSDPRTGTAWANVCHAVAEFIDAARANDDFGYEVALNNLDLLRRSFPAIDVEKVAEDFLKENPPAPKPQVPAMPADVEKLTEAEQDALAAAFAKALEAMPTAEDPFDKKEA